MKKKEMQKKSKEQLIHHNETHKLDIHTHCPYCFPHFCQTSPLPPDASKRKKLSPEREEAVEDLVDIIRENQKLKNEGKEEWEREFYGELALNDDTWNYRNNIQITPKEVKDFIRKTVSQARQQERERGARELFERIDSEFGSFILDKEITKEIVLGFNEALDEYEQNLLEELK
jgi:hypothetical protein